MLIFLYIFCKESIELDKRSMEKEYVPAIKKMPYNLLKLPTFSLECIRENVSSAAAAALAKSLVDDFHNADLLINTENLIFDKR